MQSLIDRVCRIRSWSAAVCFLAVVPVSASANAQATSAALAGTVVNEAGEPVADVALSIGQGAANATTDAGGRFEFPAVPWGQVRLRARALGYAPRDTLLNLQSGLAYTVSLRLVKFVPQLDTVQVQETLAYGKPARYRHTGRFDDFYERRAKRPGTYFTREDIERLGRARISDLLLMVPGVTFQQRQSNVRGIGTTGYLRVARCVAPVIPLMGQSGSGKEDPQYRWFALYIDGQRIQGDPMEILGYMQTSEIETMEVYRGPSQLPLAAMGDACAAMFITTRYTPGSVLTRNR